MHAKKLTQKQFVAFVAAVATLHDCQLLDINFFERVIKIEGRPKCVHACSIELTKLLGR